MEKIWNIQKTKYPDGRSPITYDGFKVSLPKIKGSTREFVKDKLKGYLGAYIDMMVTVVPYNFKDKETGARMQGFSLSLKKVEDISHTIDREDEESS